MASISDSKNKLLVYFLSPLFLAGGVWLWSLFGTALFESLRATYTWQQTTATIADYGSSHTTTMMRSGASNVAMGNTRLYRLEATYTYQVDGKDYTASRVRIFENHSNIDQAYTTELRKLMQTGSMPVYYNPANPQQAMLDPRFTPGHAAILGWLAVTFMLVGMAVIASAGKAGMALFYAYMAIAPFVLVAGLIQTLSLGLSFAGIMLLLAVILQLFMSKGILFHKPNKA